MANLFYGRLSLSLDSVTALYQCITPCGVDADLRRHCAMTILDVANAVRSAGDALVQVRGRREVVDGEERSVIGTARFFVERDSALQQVRAWTAERNNDESRNSGDAETVKVLIIVHRMAANRLGFGGVFSAPNDGAPDWLKQGFQEGADVEALAVTAFLNCTAAELFRYRYYLHDRSAFATQHGVKGAEFERVMVVMDDAESDFNLYSYEKYLGIAELSERDIENARQGTDNVVDRTRRLLYVCCTRAKRDLVLVLFTEDATRAKEKVKSAKIVVDDCVLDREALVGEQAS
jgi:superfamily I DNA/RNA helicase